MNRRAKRYSLINYLPPWLTWRVLLGALVTGSFLACVSLALLFGARPDNQNPAFATAAVNIIPAPTLTVQLTSASNGEINATPSIPPSPVPGAISLSAYVQVSGTGGTGLRLRSEPGLNGAVQLIGSESEIFIVNDGPREADGYIWWYLVGPFDESRAGWAVANYLIVVQGP